MHQRINWRGLTRQLLKTRFNTKTLGEAVGLSQPAISRLSSGKTASVGADAGVRLIELAGGLVQVPEIMEEAPAEPAAAEG